MMPVIRIPDVTFERLQAIAKPFVDTPASVIENLLDFYDIHAAAEASTKQTVKNASASSAQLKQFDPDSPPDLRHTRLITAAIGGLAASSWNELVQMAHRQALLKLKDVNSLKQLSRSNMVVGRKIDDGYHYVSDINASIQNVSATKAWESSLHLAKKMLNDISVEFEWLEKEGAAMPGKRGILKWSPSKN